MENSNLDYTEAETLFSSALEPDNNFSSSNIEYIEAKSFSSALDPDNICLSTSNKEIIKAESLSSALDPDNSCLSMSNKEGIKAESLSTLLDPDISCMSTSTKECIKAESLSTLIDPDISCMSTSTKECIKAESLSSALDLDKSLSNALARVSNNDASNKRGQEMEIFKREVGEESFSKIMKPLDDLLEEINIEFDKAKYKTHQTDTIVDSEESNLVATEQQNLAGVKNILDTITRGRLCGKWYSSKAQYYGRINREILVDWVGKCGLFFAYSAVLETIFGVKDGLPIDKEDMLNLYIQDNGRHKIITNKFTEVETDLEQWEIQYRKKFKRKKTCKSEHNTPFCGCCGWPDHWVKSFNKRGIHIKEATHWSDKNVYYSNTKEMKAILNSSTSTSN